MTSPIKTDGFSTLPPAKQREIDARTTERAYEDSAARRDVTNDRASMERARQRLAQEADTADTPAIGSQQQARERVEELKRRLQADPQAALNAHRDVYVNVFEAAMARPVI